VIETVIKFIFEEDHEDSSALKKFRIKEKNKDAK
jgi:hypothetical protein